MSNRAPEPLVIIDTDLSRPWSRLLVHVLDHAGKEVSPLTLSLSGFGPNGEIAEDARLRTALDTALAETKHWDVETVAFTIFPLRYWKLAGGDRAKLFTIYRDAFPRIRAMNPRANGRGLYFERMMMYGRGPCDGNQLEFILSQYNGRDGVRRSMLLAGVFDPGRDHVPDAQLGFPCLQQVSFVPTQAGLVVNAFYATQQIYDKAYGNYLGLVHLGAFMAHEMNLTLARVNVTVGVAKLERVGKFDQRLAPLVDIARACAAASSTPLNEHAHRQPTPAAA